MIETIRRPAVAGYFYPANATQLRDEIARLIPQTPHRFDAAGALVPHGSWTQCGSIVGSALARVRVPRHCIILGPSHTGRAMRWSLMASGAYQTPLGEVPIDRRLGEALRSRCPFLQPDAWAQRGEHAIEVLLPWLQQLGPEDLRVVPVLIASEDLEEADVFASALAEVIRQAEEPVLLLASSDLSQHANRQDIEAIDRLLRRAICALDARQFLHELQAHALSVCGWVAIVCALRTLTRLGVTEGLVTGWGTSADHGGDPHAAIGYAGIVFPAAGTTLEQSIARTCER